MFRTSLSRRFSAEVLSAYMSWHTANQEVDLDKGAENSHIQRQQ